MSLKDKAKGFLADLLDSDDELNVAIEDAQAEKKEPETEFLVYMVGDKPDCVWEYNHKPADGIKYGRLVGYFDEDKEAGVSRHFVRNESNNLKLMDYQTFIERFIPNKDQIKVYPSEADMLLDFI